MSNPAEPQEPANRTVEPSPDVDELASGVPYRAIAMVLLALVVIAVAVGIGQLVGGKNSAEETDSQSSESSLVDDQPAPAPAPEADPGAADAAGQDGAPAAGQPQDPDAEPAPAPAPAPGVATDGSRVNVVVYNNSLVPGLADRVAGNLRSGGANVTQVGNYSDSNLPHSAAYYGAAPGEQAEAQRIAQELGIEALPRPNELANSPAGVIVVVTQDLER